MHVLSCREMLHSYLHHLMDSQVRGRSATLRRCRTLARLVEAAQTGGVVPWLDAMEALSDADLHPYSGTVPMYEVETMVAWLVRARAEWPEEEEEGAEAQRPVHFWTQTWTPRLLIDGQVPTK